MKNKFIALMALALCPSAQAMDSCIVVKHFTNPTELSEISKKLESGIHTIFDLITIRQNDTQTKNESKILNFLSIQNPGFLKKIKKELKDFSHKWQHDLTYYLLSKKSNSKNELFKYFMEFFMENLKKIPSKDQKEKAKIFSDDEIKILNKAIDIIFIYLSSQESYDVSNLNVSEHISPNLKTILDLKITDSMIESARFHKKANEMFQGT
jgi:hypothetical protein